MIDHQAVRREYLLEIARRLRAPDGERISERARALMLKWEASSGVNPRYLASWRRIIAEGADAVESVAMSSTPEADELQHCMPFAGILSNRDRRKLRSKA